jgi:hypothetical protein
MIVRRFETLVVASCVVALVFLGPLRAVVAASPLIPFVSAMVLLAVPGALLVRWFAPELFPSVALVPAAVALGAGLYSLLGIPSLVMHLSLSFYLSSCGALLAVFLIVATVQASRSQVEGEQRRRDDPSNLGARWLWPPFIFLGGVLTLLAGVEVPLVDGDTWNYLAWVREYLNADRLAFHNPYFGSRTPGLSRVQINGYILEQAALSRLSGIDPITLVLRFLSPTLVAVSLLAFYAIARRLFRSEGAALLAGCLYALFLLSHMDLAPSAFGTEFLVRVVQDKGFARFVFFPVALCFAISFLDRRRLPELALFGLLCWAVVSIHPVGLAIIGLSTAGLCLFHVAIGWRQWTAWIGAAALSLTLLSILLIPAFYVLFAGHPLTSALYSADIGASNPDVLANQVFVRESWRRILLLGDGSYIMHPWLVLDPVIAAAYVLGVPFLLWRLGRGGPLAAQLLLGMLFAATIVSYVPAIATFLGDEVVGPGQLHRLSWPIPLAALLGVGWIFWEASRWISQRAGLRPQMVPLLALATIIALTGEAAPRVFVDVQRVYSFKDDPRNAAGAQLDPVFRWMQHNITETSVVLAQDYLNVAIPAYSASANVVSFRGAPILNNLRELERFAGTEIEVPQGSLDVRRFYSRPLIPSEEAEIILRRHKVDYVLVPAGSPLNAKLREMSGLARVDTPGERYAVFAVDKSALGRR